MLHLQLLSVIFELPVTNDGSNNKEKNYNTENDDDMKDALDKNVLVDEAFCHCSSWENM